MRDWTSRSRHATNPRDFSAEKILQKQVSNNQSGQRYFVLKPLLPETITTNCSLNRMVYIFRTWVCLCPSKNLTPSCAWSEASFILSCLIVLQGFLPFLLLLFLFFFHLPQGPFPSLFFFFLQGFSSSLFLLPSSSSLVSFLGLNAITHFPTLLPTFLSEVHRNQLPGEAVILNHFLTCWEM